jgi:UTP-glucose-1-phosphate uridylyltransferase/mevalonate kinase
MKIFVPGRICLFGEHSDWSGGYRRINADIEPGAAIIAGTNQGIYIDAKPHPTRFIFRTSIPGSDHQHVFDVPMERGALLEAAKVGGFFSYAAGVAYQVMTHYRVRGLDLENTLTDLPVKKGLSSSAAVCVAVARAFNRVYDLKMTVRGEMELAYTGEITTPSRCGRLDQGCAYGNRPIQMIFDGDRIDVKELSVPRDLHFVIIDLHASKDTREILRRLNQCYPFPENELQRAVHEYLGPINRRLVDQAAEALQAGDAARIGALMREAQAEFDRRLQPACPSELTAPVLHRVLNHPSLQPLIFGGKGVGSQGDGTAQIIAKDPESQARAIEIVEKELGMSALALVLRSARRVRKAVIPAGGFDTRMFPATKAIKKELFPVIDRTGRAKPVILAIVEEALSAGIEEVAIIVQAADRELFEEIFCTPPPIEQFRALSREDQAYCTYLTDIGHRITFLPQGGQEGLGHAVHCSREWVGSEPFLLLLGDHLYASASDVSCARQLLDIHERTGRNVVGLKATSGTAVSRYGCASGQWEEDGTLLDVTEFSEKPTAEYAAEHLGVQGLPNDTFLTIFGQYVLTPRVFEFLDEHIRLNLREQGQFQLTSCLDRLRQEEGVAGYVVKGRRFDIGRPDTYLATLESFRAQP